MRLPSYPEDLQVRTSQFESSKHGGGEMKKKWVESKFGDVRSARDVGRVEVPITSQNTASLIAIRQNQNNMEHEDGGISHVVEDRPSTEFDSVFGDGDDGSSSEALSDGEDRKCRYVCSVGSNKR